MDKPQRRNALIAANAKKDKPRFGSIDFGGSPLEEIDDEREKEIKREEEAKAEEIKEKKEDITADAEALPEPEKKQEVKQASTEPKKRGRKKSKQDEKRVVKTYNLTEEAVRYLEVYHMFHKNETPGVIVSEAIISYVKKKDSKIQEKIKLLFDHD